MKLHLSLKLLMVLLLTAFTNASVAQEASEEVEVETPPLVTVELPQDTLAPYLERRDSSGYYFGVTFEALELKNYVSVLDNTNVKYADAFGSNAISLIGMSFSYKRNIAIGSVAAGLSAGMGEVSSSKSGVSRKLSVTKYGLDFKYTLDAIWPEPYVAPYVGLNVWQLGLDDSTPTDKLSMTTQLGYNYSFGMLIQLDWIDYDASKSSTFNWGMENTFLDVYATQYAQTSSDVDPDTSTDFVFGAGVRLEF